MPVVNQDLDLPDGTSPADVVAQVRLVDATHQPQVYYDSNDKAIAGWATLTVSATGTWTATLTGNTSLTPSGSRYELVERLGAAPPQTTYLTVPAAGGPYNVPDILA